MEKRRLDKFKKTVARRQPDLTVILENVWDPHNVGAVLRSCDSVGIKEIFVLNTEEKLVERQKLVIGKRTSGGSSKWVDVHFYTDIAACFKHIRSIANKVYATHLGGQAKDLYELDLTEPVALLFGNEMLGVSDKVLKMCDGNFIIPQVGMAQSLNISVACAVSVYEAYRQRSEKGFYDENLRMDGEAQKELLATYVERHEMKMKPKRTVWKKEV
ncbi:MAG TPA: RNA methyltransferase [Bacteroidetes bacterium]|nr:RNA methyltransferase [Bacteroidota bacterium]